MLNEYFSLNTSLSHFPQPDASDLNAQKEREPVLVLWVPRSLQNQFRAISCHLIYERHFQVPLRFQDRLKVAERKLFQWRPTRDNEEQIAQSKGRWEFSLSLVGL